MSQRPGVRCVPVLIQVNMCDGRVPMSHSCRDAAAGDCVGRGGPCDATRRDGRSTDRTTAVVGRLSMRPCWAWPAAASQLVAMACLSSATVTTTITRTAAEVAPAL